MPSSDRRDHDGRVFSESCVARAGTFDPTPLLAMQMGDKEVGQTYPTEGTRINEAVNSQWGCNCAITSQWGCTCVIKRHNCTSVANQRREQLFFTFSASSTHPLSPFYALTCKALLGVEHFRVAVKINPGLAFHTPHPAATRNEPISFEQRVVLQCKRLPPNRQLLPT